MCWSYNEKGPCNCTLCMIKRRQRRLKELESLTDVNREVAKQIARKERDSLTDINEAVLEVHPLVQLIRERQEQDRRIKFLAFVGKVASFMEILADQIKDEVRQIREPS